MTYPPKTTTNLSLPAPPNTGTKSVYVQPRKQLTQKEIADKRAKNLCFYYDEKFVPGHKCSGQLFFLEIYADGSNSEDYDLEELLEEQVVQNFGEFIVETPLISLHAMTEESTYKTMRVKAYVGKHTVYSLIDSGDIKWNFKDLVMDFVYKNKRMVLRRIQKATLQWMSRKRHPKEAKILQVDH
ncbi:hypothetical protein Tco_1098070, partial [Tanacetum coccineum]